MKRRLYLQFAVGAAKTYMTSLGLGIDIVSLLEVEQEERQTIKNRGPKSSLVFFLGGGGGIKTIKATNTNGSTCLAAREVAHLVVLHIFVYLIYVMLHTLWVMI